MRAFELNKTLEDDEICKIEKEIERAKCKEKMNKLEVNDEEIESGLKDKTN